MIKMMQAPDFVNKVVVLINQAQQEETRNALPKALQCYEQALAIMSNILQNKQHKYLAETINSYASQCLSKAEHIKELIQSGGRLEDDKKSSTGTTYHDEECSEDKRRMMQDLALTKINAEDIGVSWDDIVGMRHIKKVLDDAIHLPREMPHLFTGNRVATQSLLLYGPPGTGKTMIGKAVAGSAKIAFYSVSSAELISKYVGESEKYVKSLFEIVKHNKPCILFLDELESLCARREESTHTKTVQQFLVQLDGISQSGSMEGVFLMGCTNMPWQLDEAMLRRLEKRIYVPLPLEEEREALLRFYLTKNECTIKDKEFGELARRTAHFSAADIHQLAKTAAMLPIDVMRCAEAFELLEDGRLRPCDLSHRQGLPMSYEAIEDKQLIVVPPITYALVLEALQSTKSTVDLSSLRQYEEWTDKYGQ